MPGRLRRSPIHKCRGARYIGALFALVFDLTRVLPWQSLSPTSSILDMMPPYAGC
jgi:hypothetical protein